MKIFKKHKIKNYRWPNISAYYYRKNLIVKDSFKGNTFNGAIPYKKKINKLLDYWLLLLKYNHHSIRQNHQNPNIF